MLLNNAEGLDFPRGRRRLTDSMGSWPSHAALAPGGDRPRSRLATAQSFS